MIKAKCKQNCIWKGKYWEAGEVYEGTSRPPRHFDVISGPEEGTPKKRGKGE